MKKLLCIIVLLFLSIALFVQLSDKPQEKPYSDTPTEQEQQELEATQEAPEAISESEMETQFPENAERD